MHCLHYKLKYVATRTPTPFTRKCKQQRAHARTHARTHTHTHTHTAAAARSRTRTYHTSHIIDTPLHFISVLSPTPHPSQHTPCPLLHTHTHARTHTHTHTPTHTPHPHTHHRSAPSVQLKATSEKQQQQNVIILPIVLLERCPNYWLVKEVASCHNKRKVVLTYCGQLVTALWVNVEHQRRRQVSRHLNSFHRQRQRQLWPSHRKGGQLAFVVRCSVLRGRATLRASLSGTFLRRKDVVNQCLVFGEEQQKGEILLEASRRTLLSLAGRGIVSVLCRCVSERFLVCSVSHPDITVLVDWA